MEIRRVAILADSPIKEVFPFLAKGSYLVLEVYDKADRFLFELPQNLFAKAFSLAETPYDTLFSVWERLKTEKN